MSHASSLLLLVLHDFFFSLSLSLPHIQHTHTHTHTLKDTCIVSSSIATACICIIDNDSSSSLLHLLFFLLLSMNNEPPQPTPVSEVDSTVTSSVYPFVCARRTESHVKQPNLQRVISVLRNDDEEEDENIKCAKRSKKCKFKADAGDATTKRRLNSYKSSQVNLAHSFLTQHFICPSERRDHHCPIKNQSIFFLTVPDDFAYDLLLAYAFERMN